MQQRRQHGVIEDGSRRVVGMDPATAHQVIRSPEDYRYPLTAACLTPPRVEVVVGASPVGTLDNGLGANWSPLGQGAEAFPENTDEDGWKLVFDGMDQANIQWVRFWLQPRGVMRDGKVDPHHVLLHQFDRLQDWAKRRNAWLMLDLGHVPEEFQAGGLCDAPADNAAYVAQYIVPLLRHVVTERGGDRIRQLCLFNEPFNPDVAPYIFFPANGDPLDAYLDLHERLREALDQAGLGMIGLIGPNSANLFQRHVEMFEDRGWHDRVARAFAELDCHLWRMRFDYYPPSVRWPGYTMSEGIERYLRPTVAAARRLGKRLSLTEVGAMYFNDHPRTDRTTRHDAVLTMIEQAVRAINEGVAGIMFWSYTSSARIDGQWGWIATAERRFARVPHLFNGFAALLSGQRVGAHIHPCAASPSDFSRHVAAACIACPRQGETIWLVNDHPVQPLTVTVALPAPLGQRPWRLWRKGFDENLVSPEPPPHTPGKLHLELPPMTLTTATT